MTSKQLERVTERQMTAALRRAFGESYYALARHGDREICRYVDATTGAPSTAAASCCIDMVRAKTWAEVIAKARAHFGWSRPADLFLGLPKTEGA